MFSLCTLVHKCNHKNSSFLCGRMCLGRWGAPNLLIAQNGVWKEETAAEEKQKFKDLQAWLRGVEDVCKKASNITCVRISVGLRGLARFDKEYFVLAKVRINHCGALCGLALRRWAFTISDKSLQRLLQPHLARVKSLNLEDSMNTCNAPCGNICTDLFRAFNVQLVRNTFTLKVGSSFFSLLQTAWSEVWKWQ